MPLSAMLPILQAVFHEGVVITADALGNICLKPRSQFQPKGFIFGAIVKFHDSSAFRCMRIGRPRSVRPRSAAAPQSIVSLDANHDASIARLHRQPTALSRTQGSNVVGMDAEAAVWVIFAPGPRANDLIRVIAAPL